MKLHFFQQVSFEDPAGIVHWAEIKGHDITFTHFWRDTELPKMRDFDWLIIMGGPMNVSEQKKCPWLAKEKEFIRNAIVENKIILGICLGAQLIAEILGSKIYKNRLPEIGWHPVSLTEDARCSLVFSVLPDNFIPFHWHGDTFTLPLG